MKSLEVKEVLFRKSIMKIPTTTYGVFSLYKYPAKFIPQVPAFVMENYAKPGMKIFDPFAGFGTVGLVARLYGLSYELWDLNPMLEYIHSVVTSKLAYLDIIEIIKNHTVEFIPKWSNIGYWHPEEFLRILAKAWGVYHSSDQLLKNILLIPLLKTTKYFSYADEKVHKLYKSRYAKEKVDRLLKQDYQALFYSMLDKELKETLKKLSEYQKLKPKDVPFNIRAGVDVLEEDLREYAHVMLTSPPYLQAQEYIRTTKLELFWLGFDEDHVKELSKKEIPYRHVKKIEIKSSTYYTYRALIQEQNLIELYDNYFHAILGVFERLSQKITDYLFIFVGPAKIRGLRIPIHEIITEHMIELGFTHEITYVDKIVSRVMFSTKKNPATGLEDSRMDREYLVVLKNA